MFIPIFFSLCHKSLCNILNQTKQKKSYSPIYHVTFLTAFWLKVMSSDLPQKEFHETHSWTWRHSYPPLTPRPSASLVKCHVTVGAHEVCILISTSKAFQVSRFQILGATELFWTPRLVWTVSSLPQKSPSHPATLAQAAREEPLMYDSMPTIQDIRENEQKEVIHSL